MDDFVQRQARCCGRLFGGFSDRDYGYRSDVFGASDDFRHTLVVESPHPARSVSQSICGQVDVLNCCCSVLDAVEPSGPFTVNPDCSRKVCAHHYCYGGLFDEGLAQGGIGELVFLFLISHNDEFPGLPVSCAWGSNRCF